MIIKAKVREKFKGCVNYVLGKKDAQILQVNHVSNEISRHIIQDFEVIRSMRPRVRNAVWHTSVSFAYDDTVTDELMLKISSDYLKQMNLNNNQYLIVKHSDTKHQHFHIVASRIGLDGSLVSDSWCRNRSANVSDKLELKYNLTIATQQKRNPLRQDASSLKGFAKTKKDVKEFIKISIDDSIQQGVYTIDELTLALHEKGIELLLQKRNDGSINGVSFRAQNLAFKGSSIHKNYRAKALLSILVSQAMKNRNTLKL